MAWFKDRMVGSGIISTKKLTVAPVIPDFTAAVETGNAISVTIQMKDPDGTAVARAVDCICYVKDSNGLTGLIGAWRLAETGVGAEVTATAKPTLVITTDAAGAAIITITDVSGSFSGSIFLVVEPVNTLGTAGLLEVVFA